jgi:uncharacterized membrane protein YedE/YeeE
MNHHLLRNGITTGESKIGGLLWATAVDPSIRDTLYYKTFKLVNPLNDPTQMIVIAILLGGLIGALALGEFGLKHFPNHWMLLQAVIGGFLLGYGARLALGCNIGNYLSAWASAGLNAITFTAGMIPGIGLGTIVVERIFLFRARPLPIYITPSLWVQRLLLAVAIAVAVVLYMLSEGVMAKLWFVFGVAFGLIGYLSKICWATGLREITNPYYGGGRMVSATALAILTYAILALPMVVTDPDKISFALARGTGQLQIFIGGLIFGAGMGIAGTCIFSSEWRAGGGSIYSMIVLASTISLGMPILAYHYEFWLKTLPQPYPNITLYTVLGPVAILVVIAYVGTLILLPKLRGGKILP